MDYHTIRDVATRVKHTSKRSETLIRTKLALSHTSWRPNRLISPPRFLDDPNSGDKPIESISLVLLFSNNYIQIPKKTKKLIIVVCEDNFSSLRISCRVGSSMNVESVSRREWQSRSKIRGEILHPVDCLMPAYFTRTTFRRGNKVCSSERAIHP